MQMKNVKCAQNPERTNIYITLELMVSCVIKSS